MRRRKCNVAYPGIYETSERKFAEKFPLPGVKGSPRLLVGRREWLALPLLGVEAVHAKVDTGARSSSLHAAEIETFEKDGESWVSFMTQDRHGRRIDCELPVIHRKTVKSSNGVAQERIFIETPARSSGGVEWSVVLSLSNRGEMKCPLLLGRLALSGRFVVDTQRTNLLGSAVQLERGRS